MRLDKFNNPIFDNTDVFELLYQGNTSVLRKLTVDINQELVSLENTSGIQFIDQLMYDQNMSIAEFDENNQKQWFMPDEYKNFDILAYILGKCTNSIEQSRVLDEYQEYERHNMIDLLRWCKYFVDTCINNDIIWGVGRGSSVASYILYLIGVHRINSLKYNLDWKEFPN